MTKAYTQEEVDILLQEQLERFEARNFEEKTEEVLNHINKRLNEANGYKNTIGKDVKEVKEEVQDIKRRVISLEDARTIEAKKVKEDLEARQKREDQRRAWYQEERGFWVALIFGGATVLWEIINVYQATGGSIHQVIR